MGPLPHLLQRVDVVQLQELAARQVESAAEEQQMDRERGPRVPDDGAAVGAAVGALEDVEDAHFLRILLRRALEAHDRLELLALRRLQS